VRFFTFGAVAMVAAMMTVTPTQPLVMKDFD
jgi:hypothetical protein